MRHAIDGREMSFIVRWCRRLIGVCVETIYSALLKIGRRGSGRLRLLFILSCERCFEYA